MELLKDGVGFAQGVVAKTPYNNTWEFVLERVKL